MKIFKTITFLFLSCLSVFGATPAFDLSSVTNALYSRGDLLLRYDLSVDGTSRFNEISITNGLTLGGTRKTTWPVNINIREIWVPANAMSPGLDGPTASTNIWATTTDGQRIESWDFSATSTNSLYWTMVLPQAWNGGTVKAKIYWKQVLAEANTTNVWVIGGGSVNDGEEGGNTLGTLITILDQGLNNTNQIAITVASSAITIGGSPSAGHLTWFTVRRHPGDPSDNMTVLSRLIGVHIQFTETSTEINPW